MGASTILSQCSKTFPWFWLLDRYGFSAQLARHCLIHYKSTSIQKSTLISLDCFQFILSRISVSHWILIFLKLCKIGIDFREARNTSVFILNHNITWIMELHDYLIETSNNLVVIQVWLCWLLDLIHGMLFRDHFSSLDLESHSNACCISQLELLQWPLKDLSSFSVHSFCIMQHMRFFFLVFGLVLFNSPCCLKHCICP